MKSSPENQVFTIGETADRFGLPTHVLRHWESEGLIEPARVGGQRRYSTDNLYRIAIILNAKDAAFGLNDIRDMLTSADRREVLRRHHAQLTERVTKAQEALDLIECALNCDHEDFTNCPNFQARLESRVNNPATTTPQPQPRPLGAVAAIGPG